MNRSQWIALASTLVQCIACFMPWVHISSAGLTLSGIDTAGTSFGKPAYMHFILATVVLIVTFIPRIWAKRINLLFAALNFAWGIKNFILFSRCEAGECPQKQTGIYLMLMAATALLLTAFFPDMKMDTIKENGATSSDASSSTTGK